MVLHPNLASTKEQAARDESSMLCQSLSLVHAPAPAQMSSARAPGFLGSTTSLAKLDSQQEPKHRPCNLFQMVRQYMRKLCELAQMRALNTAQDPVYGAELEFSDLHTQASFLSQRSELPTDQPPLGGHYGAPGG